MAAAERERQAELERELGELFAKVVAVRNVSCAPNNIEAHFAKKSVNLTAGALED